MAIQDNDNRIQFPPTLVDFGNVVGITGQLHDLIPAPGQQPRYDWFRIYLIGLLSNQSSVVQPSEYRIGTIWYNKTTNGFEYYNGTSFVDISNAILLVRASDPPITLQQFYLEIIERINSIKFNLIFNGEVVSDETAKIPVPNSVLTKISSDQNSYRPLLYVNGLLHDPRTYQFSIGCPNFVELLTFKIKKGDKFTVDVRHFDVFEINTIHA